MAEAPRPRRQRRQRRQNGSAAPTADATPSGLPNVEVVNAPRRSRRRQRRVPRRRPRVPNVEIVDNNFMAVGPRRRGRLNRAIKRELKREGLEGPKVSVQQKITSTFGLIGPNTTGNTELELNFFLHPALAKEANDGTAFGPLQALAAQYSLWKIKYLTLRFTPMVGASAVSGTVIRASLNLSQSPGGNNWSGLGTRLHIDMHPGQVQTFHLRGDQVGGPRDGGWWFTDTNEEGSQSAGPIVEVHTMGRTKSTFKSEDWQGPLFLVEGIGLWQFANYQVKPALGQLERREDNVTADIDANAGQPITLDLPDTAALTTFMSDFDPDVPSDRAVGEKPSVGETIFQIVDVGAGLAQSVAPPPFGWLIKGGWWFVKKLLGRARSGKTSFAVYASLQDAQNNKPAIATQTVSIDPVSTRLIVTQINSPNVGPNPTFASTRSGAQNLTPNESFRIQSEMISELFVDLPLQSGSPNNQSVPVSLIPGTIRKFTDDTVLPPQQQPATGVKYFIQTPWWVGAPGRAPHVNPASSSSPVSYLPSRNSGGYLHALYRLINPEFSDLPGFHEFLPPTTDLSQVNFSVMNNFWGNAGMGIWDPNTNPPGTVTADNPYAVYGKVVATNSITAGTVNPITMIFNLIKITNDYSLDLDKVPYMVAILGTEFGKAAPTILPLNNGQTEWNIRERRMPIDQYLLGIAITDAPETVNGVDISTTLPFKSFSRVEGNLSPVFPYNLIGQMFPGTSTDLVMRYVEYHPPSRDLISQLQALSVPMVLPILPEVSRGSPSTSSGGVVEPEEIVLEISDEDDDSEHTDSGSETDSVDEFFLALTNEMISLPRRWVDDPRFSVFLQDHE